MHSLFYRSKQRCWSACARSTATCTPWSQLGQLFQGKNGVGYSLVEGYRLLRVLFTREEAQALLTTEKLAAHLTDAPTAQLASAAIDKVRAVLRQPDRDHLPALAPHIQVFGPSDQPADMATYQQLVEAIATRRLVRLHQQTPEASEFTVRDVEPIGL